MPDTAPVASQSLEKAEDSKLIEWCRREGRASVSLDLDFADPLRFRPQQLSRHRRVAAATQTRAGRFAENRPDLAAGPERENLDENILGCRSGQNPGAS